MSASDVRDVKKARKQHQCDWCREMIEEGEPYRRWFDYTERVMCKVHLECFDAMEENCSEWDEVELDMEFQRGSTRRKGDYEDENEG